MVAIRTLPPGASTRKHSLSMDSASRKAREPSMYSL